MKAETTKEGEDFTATVEITGRLGRDIEELVRAAIILALTERRRVAMTANGRRYVIEPYEILQYALKKAILVEAP